MSFPEMPDIPVPRGAPSPPVGEIIEVESGYPLQYHRLSDGCIAIVQVTVMRPGEMMNIARDFNTYPDFSVACQPAAGG